MKSNFRKIFMLAFVTSGFAACGVQETSLKPAGEFDPETGDTATDAGQPDSTTPAADSGAVQESDTGTTADAGTTDQTADSGTVAPPANADVARSTANCHLELSTLYIAGAASGEIRGNIPGIATWSSGPAISDDDADGYLDFAPASLPVGSFDFSYVSSSGTWALYGDKEQLRSMTAAARSFVACNWFDGSVEVATASPECHLSIAVAADCVVIGAGNMANLQ